jgi:hypothetical protein
MAGAHIWDSVPGGVLLAAIFAELVLWAITREGEQHH